MVNLKSDAPIPGASPVLALKRCVANTFKFSGRASRNEYWWMTGLVMAIGAVPLSFDIKKNRAENKRLRAEAEARGEEIPKPKEVKFSVATWATAAVLAPSMVSLEARRLHDANRSAAWMLLSPIDAILCLLPSNPRGTRFDKVPSDIQDMLS